MDPNRRGEQGVFPDLVSLFQDVNSRENVNDLPYLTVSPRL